ncbi:MAG: hypothetical protein AAGA93_02980 [Actinomycetota bacterium]
MGRKTRVTFSKRKTRSDRSWADSDPFDLDRIRELETENALLRARVLDLTTQLDSRAPAGPDLVIEPDGDRHDGHLDEEAEAFDAFLAVSDPHLDRVRRFLLG